ncbi:MAG: type II toxin-antitoxin system RelE/ParE family toxin [Candidatus Woesearchaeota archaeon]
MNIDTLEIANDLQKIKKKDPVLFQAISKKIIQVASCDSATITHFKNLRGNLKEYKRVHVGSFVLLFKIEDDTVIFTEIKHHDEAYE